MRPVERKSDVGAAEQVGHTPECSATYISYRPEIFDIEIGGVFLPGYLLFAYEHYRFFHDVTQNMKVNERNVNNISSFGMNMLLRSVSYVFYDEIVLMSEEINTIS